VRRAQDKRRRSQVCNLAPFVIAWACCHGMGWDGMGWDGMGWGNMPGCEVGAEGRGGKGGGGVERGRESV